MAAGRWRAAAAVCWQLARPPHPSTMATAGHPPELPAVEPTRPFQLPPLDRYGEIALHPLFIAARQPEPPPPDEASPEEPPPPPGPEQKLTLLGVMITSKVKKALLRSEEPNVKTVTARIGPGETVGEWRLEAVFSDRVVLRKGQSTQELPLIRRQKPMGTPAERAAWPECTTDRSTGDCAKTRRTPPPGRRHNIMDKGSIFMKKACFTLACALLALLLGACATAPADQNVQDSTEQPAVPATSEALRLTSAPLPSAARPAGRRPGQRHEGRPEPR